MNKKPNLNPTRGEVLERALEITLEELERCYFNHCGCLGSLKHRGKEEHMKILMDRAVKDLAKTTEVRIKCPHCDREYNLKLNMDPPEEGSIIGNVSCDFCSEKLSFKLGIKNTYVGIIE